MPLDRVNRTQGEALPLEHDAGNVPTSGKAHCDSKRDLTKPKRSLK